MRSLPEHATSRSPTRPEEREWSSGSMGLKSG
jgi:hypothetical protein